MLREHQLFGYVDLVAKAVERFKAFEAQAIAMNPAGYHVAFSGGKDSIVIKDLFLKSGCKGSLHFNLTTVDPPELTQYIKQQHPDVIWHRPAKTMFKLWVEKMMPPTRMVRYCCEVLKEGGGKNSFVVTGVRWAESLKRSKRKMTEVCFKDSRKRYLNPIIEWSDADVWQYIRENKLPYCCLYDEGFKRIGCVGCPMAGKQRIAEFKRWPRYERLYKAAAAAAAVVAKNIQDKGSEYSARRGKGRVLRWKDGAAMWKWWMEENHEDDSDQGVLFE
jgi:phosphoadenosine phosphosulfate reductase